jgi:hypothetical protein
LSAIDLAYGAAILCFFGLAVLGCGGFDESDEYQNDARAKSVSEEFVQRLVVDRDLERARALASPSVQFHIREYYRSFVARGGMHPQGDVKLQLPCGSTGFGARSAEHPCYAVRLCGTPFRREGGRNSLLFGTLHLWIGKTYRVESCAHVGGAYSYPAGTKNPNFPFGCTSSNRT